MFRTYLSVLILMTGSLAAYGKHPKVDKDLGSIDAESTVDVIIQYKQVPGAGHHKKVHDKGGQHKRDLSLIKGGHYSLTAKTIRELADDPDVVAISPDREVRGTMDVAAPTVNATIANQNTWTGAGIGVAVIDSGIQDAADLKTVVYKQSFVSGGKSTDVYGHGTHVAGIIAGDGSSSSGKYKGVAPQANIIVLRVLDDNGVGTDSSVIAAIQRAIALKATYNIRVINLSLGRPVTSRAITVDPLCLAVEAAWKAGIVVVVAAGQRRPESIAEHGRLRDHHLAGERPVRDHSRRDEDHGDRVTGRRPDRQLQLEGADAARSRGEARPGGAGQPDDLAEREERH